MNSFKKEISPPKECVDTAQLRTSRHSENLARGIREWIARVLEAWQLLACCSMRKSLRSLQCTGKRRHFLLGLQSW
ncbi:KIAA1430-like protein [Platysternon megacephalum]|uniref:KIAA1430-like protein n=1 Tax=Platysternon megacephalum TaxID=55544 RepID=A0A4D9EZA2_9SAUR|nr:KIAA1430-like protein [Platysternon megacephalum]